jgi:hypothetical protein
MSPPVDSGCLKIQKQESCQNYFRGMTTGCFTKSSEWRAFFYKFGKNPGFRKLPAAMRDWFSPLLLAVSADDLFC